MKQISVRVDDDLHEAIEETRGKVPREAWMREVLWAAVDRSEPAKPDAYERTGTPKPAAAYHSVLAERQRRLEKERKR
jgi:hypothetical protein